MRASWPTAELVHLPIHASWLNQIEIVFSILGRKALRPADFADLGALTARLEAFAPRFNATAAPFDWRFGRAELTDLCRRLDMHRPAGTRPLAA
jgi:transposase